jgi:hypothetical protein
MSVVKRRLKRCEQHGNFARLCRECHALGIGGEGICDCGLNRLYCHKHGQLICEHGHRKKICGECNCPPPSSTPALPLLHEWMTDPYFIRKYIFSREYAKWAYARSVSYPQSVLRNLTDIPDLAEVDIDLNLLPSPEVPDFETLMMCEVVPF